MMILKVVPLSEDIETSGIEGVNRIWWEAKFKGVRLKIAKAWYEAAGHSIGETIKEFER